MKRWGLGSDFFHEEASGILGTAQMAGNEPLTPKPEIKTELIKMEIPEVQTRAEATPPSVIPPTLTPSEIKTEPKQEEVKPTSTPIPIPIPKSYLIFFRFDFFG